MDFIGKLVGGTYTTEDVTIMKKLVENMFDCLGVSCNEVGGYMGKEPCDDNVRNNALATIGGYLPTNIVNDVSTFCPRIALVLRLKSSHCISYYPLPHILVC